MRLEGKAAGVTGAAQGIGRAIAVEISKEGASVVVADVDTERGMATVAAINKIGRETGLFVETDVSVEEQVSNAGIIIRDRVQDNQPDDWAWVFVVNVNGTDR